MEQDDVVSKPFRIPELIPKITEVISKSKAIALSSPNIKRASPKAESPSLIS